MVNKEQADKIRYEKAFLASAAKLITDVTWETNWSLFASIFGFGGELEESPRLLKSQFFKDPDYPSCVLRFLESAYEVAPDRAVSLIKYVIGELKKLGMSESEIDRNPVLKAFLESKDFSDFSLVMPRILKTKYLQLKELPDDFYYDLVDLINKAFTYGLCVPVRMLTRKLLENLLVDILRRKFGMRKVELFYDTKYNGFKDFKTLIKNFEDKISEFQKIVPEIDSGFIKALDRFREQGNSAAHTLEIQLKEKDLEENKEELEVVIKTLVRLFHNC